MLPHNKLAEDTIGQAMCSKDSVRYSRLKFHSAVLTSLTILWMDEKKTEFPPTQLY